MHADCGRRLGLRGTGGGRVLRRPRPRGHPGGQRPGQAGGAEERARFPSTRSFCRNCCSGTAGTSLHFSDDLHAAVRASDGDFHRGGHSADRTGRSRSVLRGVGGARTFPAAINGYKVVVEKSTVPVYTSDWVRKIILRNAAPPDSFDVASNPEFLREGTAVTDFLFPDRIVVGADSERCAAVLREIYAPLTDGIYYKRKDAIPAPDRAQIPPPLIVTSAKSAELIKHASNAFLAMKISFINAVASICESVGANVQQVCQGSGRTAASGRAS